MSWKPITVSLNSNNSKRFAFLPSNSLESTVIALKEAILHESRNKFRLKGLSLVYLKGGQVLDEEHSQLIPDLDQVWVSKGEPYSGPAGAGSSGAGGELRVIRGKSYIDSGAVKQLEQVSKLPGVQIAVGMPDLHPGNRFPIGCAVACDGIYPALIGSDAGCGIALYHLSSKSKANPKRLAALLRGLDDPWTGSVSEWLKKYGIDRVSSFDASLGTLGQGNHFLEILICEEMVDEETAAHLGLVQDALYLLVHTGSRGLGASLLASQTATDSNPYLLPGSSELDAYLQEHEYAVKWAIANRDLVAHRVKQCLGEEGSSADLGKIIDVTHNSVTKHPLSWSNSSENRDLWVHRKGAAPADKGIVPCPGSRGDFSWLLRPTGDGQTNVHSLAHGAGRRFGRNVLHSGSKQISKASLTTTKLGSEVICSNNDLLLEERPEAYKDVACVVDDMTEHGICQGIVILRPVVTYKVG
ncbi:release factor H-coupled R [Mycena floridula]|nr:release factor H-coupled R [Mycena floridula]